MTESEAGSVSAPLGARIRAEMDAAGGWLPFDRFMALALYTPDLGYYANAHPKLGRMPADGSDFVTAPEMSPLFGQALAAQVREGLVATGGQTVYEFGAGSGALAEQLLQALGDAVQRYIIVDLSGTLRARQAERLKPFAPRVAWCDTLPDELHGVIVGNEVLDAMPVQLLHFDGGQWSERGVAVDAAGAFVWADRPTSARPPVDAPFVPGTVTEIHPQAQAFIRTLAGRMTRALALFIDYGFPEAEYWLPQRHMGTLVCHRAHRVDADPLADVGTKDITAHVDFTGVALAAQEAGLEVVGYTSQARFLINCGIVDLMAQAGVAERAMAQKLITEHEMGELFKVVALARGLEGPADQPLVGFREGDRTHRL
ncbi:SAM-dependent methyltransferase [Ideonella sp. DXS29W]|uniref:SAM-dependent methyltransferase n=1 Tax=Ideonella lacteola TaxID=2984193 RepID=A0ABU9BR39_9BURK